jgi:hypothetical protein
VGTGFLLTGTRSRGVPFPDTRGSFPLYTDFELRLSLLRELESLELLELLESLPRLLSLFELLLELLLFELLLLGLGSLRDDSVGALGVSLFGLSLGGVRSCAFEMVATTPNTRIRDVVVTPFRIPLRLSFMAISLW